MPVIKLYANLRKLAGMKELSVLGATLGVVLNGLIEQKPALGGVILERGEILPQVVITLNGHNASDLRMQVTEEDVIAIFPPIAGG